MSLTGKCDIHRELVSKFEKKSIPEDLSVDKS